jgi:hypothetical protein
MAEQDKLTGADIRGGVTMADDVMHGVQNDLRALAKETRWEGIRGKDREEFFRGMSQDEYDTLKEVAFAMGPKGTAKLESVLQEMVNMKGSN